MRAPGEFNFESGVAAAEFYASLENRPTAILCCADDSAIGFIKAATLRGIRVPEDVSVIGFDGSRVGA